MYFKEFYKCEVSIAKIEFEVDLVVGGGFIQLIDLTPQRSPLLPKKLHTFYFLLCALCFHRVFCALNSTKIVKTYCL